MITTNRLNIRMATDAEMRDMILEETNAGLKAAYGEMQAGCMAHPEQRQWYAPWLIFAGNEKIGDLCFKGLSPDGTVEIGYGLLPEFWGRGYATEAVTAAVIWASRQPGVSSIEAETEADNAVSQRVLQKSGFIPNGKMGEEGPRFVWRGEPLK